MTRIKNLRGECQHCGGRIEFHVEHVGTAAECPHCGQQTELMLPPPPDSSGPIIPVRSIVFTIIAVLILGGGLVGAIVALKRAQHRAVRQTPVLEKTRSQNAPTPADPIAAAGFRVTTVTLGTAAGSSIIHAVGSVWNDSDRRRFGVKVELELLNAAGVKIGEARDYQQTLEPRAEWKFKALVTDSRAVSARVTAIKEDR